MRENTYQRRRIQLLALGLTLAPLLATPALAESFKLGSVDFVNSGDKTGIILHTGSIVPVQKVLVSDNKLILDIDHINADETIRTNFTGAANISHVIMQPLSEHKIRMIVRGESLGAPSVAFYNSNNNFKSTAAELDKLSSETSTALHAIQEEGMQPATFSGEPAGEEFAADTFEAASDLKPIATAPAKTGTEALAPLSLSNRETTGSGDLNGFFDQLAGGKADKYIPYGLLALVLLGGGFFIRQQILRLSNREPQLEDLLKEQADGRRVSFREMAGAYRNRDNQPAPKASSASASKKSSADDLIGLRALKQMALPDEAPAVPKNNPAISKPEPAPVKTLEQLISSMQGGKPQGQFPKTPAPKAPLPTPAPKKQVINQYIQQQSTQAQKPIKSRAAAKQRLSEEIKHRDPAIAPFQPEVIRRAPQAGLGSPANAINPAGGSPINRAPAARKATGALKSVTHSTGGGGPLPGNPEVLNFLRNVADLMEKDGKPGMAQSIHKNLNPNKLGLT